jgi:hypothetical protein
MSYMQEANAIAAALRGGRAVAARQHVQAAASPHATRRTRGRPTSPSPRNLAVLAYMREFFQQNDQLPPMSAIAAHFGVEVSAAYEQTLALRRFGLVELNAVGKLRFVRADINTDSKVEQ